MSHRPWPYRAVAAVALLALASPAAGSPAAPTTPQVVPNESPRDTLPVASEPPADVRGPAGQDPSAAPGGTGAAVTSDLSPAEAARVDSLTAEVANQLRCPVCRSQSVLESTSTLAREMQGVIREKLAAGESPAAVKEYFVGKYGSWVLLKPEPEGVGLLVYLLPALALLGGGWIVFGALRRWSRRPEGDAAAGATGDSPAGAGSPGASPDAPAASGRERPGSRLPELEGVSDEEQAWLRGELEERNQRGQRL